MPCHPQSGADADSGSDERIIKCSFIRGSRAHAGGPAGAPTCSSRSSGKTGVVQRRGHSEVYLNVGHTQTACRAMHAWTGRAFSTQHSMSTPVEIPTCFEGSLEQETRKLTRACTAHAHACGSACKRRQGERRGKGERERRHERREAAPREPVLRWGALYCKRVIIRPSTRSRRFGTVVPRALGFALPRQALNAVKTAAHSDS